MKLATAIGFLFSAGRSVLAKLQTVSERMDNAWKKRRRERLWEQQRGRCYYCSRPMLHWSTFEPDRGKSPPEVLCTIEHLRDRYDSRRFKTTVNQEQRLVLACYACNHNRGAERQKVAAAGVLRYGAKRDTAYGVA